MIREIIYLIGVVAVSIVILAVIVAVFEWVKGAIERIGERGYWRGHRKAHECVYDGKCYERRRLAPRVYRLINVLRRERRISRATIGNLTRDYRLMRANWERLNELRQYVIDHELMTPVQLDRYL